MCNSMKPNLITPGFIRRWAARYDVSAGDEAEYLDLISQLAKETKAGRVSFETVLRVVTWKTPRIKGRMMMRMPDKYCRFVQLAHDTPDPETKLWLLTSLEGWGIPMASTMLHLLHPDQYPIIDVRVRAALCENNGFKCGQSSDTDYWRYCTEIETVRKASGCSLRELDRALWAWDEARTRTENQSKKRRAPNKAT